MIDALTQGFAILAGLLEGDIPSLSLSRAVGYLCYILLSFSIVAGLLVQTRRFSKPVTAVLDLVHQWAGNWTVYTSLVHALLLAVGSKRMGWAHTLLPSFSGEPGWPVALGIYALYGFLAVTVSGYLLGAIKGYLWRWIHWLAFPSWLLALLHALLSSHRGEPAWVLPMHAFFAVAVIGLTVARFTNRRPAGTHGATPSQATPLRCCDGQIHRLVATPGIMDRASTAIDDAAALLCQAFAVK